MEEGDSKSALSQNQVMTGHKVLSTPIGEGVSVIDSEPRNMHRKVKKAIHIKLDETTLNSTGGYDLPELYLPLWREETMGNWDRVTGHASTANITSGMAVLLEEATLLVVEI